MRSLCSLIPLLTGFSLFFCTSINHGQQATAHNSSILDGDKAFLKLDPNLQRAYSRLKPVFIKYYPKAVSWSYRGEDFRFEYETKNFDFNSFYKKEKHPNPIQQGSQKGGILCQVQGRNEPYKNNDQLYAIERTGKLPCSSGKNPFFETTFYYPSFPGKKGHYVVMLSYPADTSAEFLNSFKEVLLGLEKP